MENLQVAATQSSVKQDSVQVAFALGEILAQKIASAVTGFRAKHPQASEEEVNAFREGVAGSMIASTNSNVRVNEAKEREVRRTAINKLIAEHGLNFRSLRKFVLAPVDEGVAEEFVDSKGRPCVHTEVTLMMQPSHLGGVTFVYRTKEDGTAEYAAAFCRADENYDRLLGKETAIERFLNGERVTVDPGSLMADLSKFVFNPEFSDEDGDQIGWQLELFAKTYGREYLGFHEGSSN